MSRNIAMNRNHMQNILVAYFKMSWGKKEASQISRCSRESASGWNEQNYENLVHNCWPPGWESNLVPSSTNITLPRYPGPKNSTICIRLPLITLVAVYTTSSYKFQLPQSLQAISRRGSSLIKDAVSFSRLYHRMKFRNIAMVTDFLSTIQVWKTVEDRQLKLPMWNNHQWHDFDA